MNHGCLNLTMMSFNYSLLDPETQLFAQQLYATNFLLAEDSGRLYGNHAIFPVEEPVPQQEVEPSPDVAPDFAPLHELRQQDPVTAQVFRGEKEKSSTRCYAFICHKKTSRDDTLIYRCSGCRQQSGKFTSVHVTDDVFRTDPCQLTHNCLPLDRYRDKANRVAYQNCHQLRADPKAYRTPPQRHYSNIADIRHAVGKAALAQRRRVEMDNIPKDLGRLPGGENFLKLQTPELHTYYSEEVILKARNNGLYALIADGVHKLNPITIPDRMDKGQLYIVHAVVSGGIEVPILYAITRYKNVETYRTIFDRLSEIVADSRLERIVLDFEKAAIRAAREEFPNTEVQGCAFHLAQAWNRMAKELGLAQFVKGKKKIGAVARWWRIIKGIVFLPYELIERVPALRSPPVNPDSPAYVPCTPVNPDCPAYVLCTNFLKYLQEVWFDGTYQGMWYKWDVQELRTSNTAEAFHR
ncbi:hypothetical protein ANCCAN_01138 [Ancylostoma caninum]|uniref:MULE transposase domain-containing protein n=1 Tax=Ancylostoma caninum TaxID=29170 RepID=A0A368H832_ANCCA|nr:hypothetical protein ANCCAN_01138 [Ancylostoma caninum]